MEEAEYVAWEAICTVSPEEGGGKGILCTGGSNLIHVPGGTENISADGRSCLAWCKSAEVFSIAYVSTHVNRRSAICGK